MYWHCFPNTMCSRDVSFLYFIVSSESSNNLYEINNKFISYMSKLKLQKVKSLFKVLQSTK